ncbi:hypothetical protein [Streptomyces sp. NPDC020742]|uniref:hypothetical protein n=1 Tax=unclassified Streptomyces TaxID=2593676 RepID=UPI0033FF8403
MRDTVSTGRSAATGAWRVLLLLTLLALLHTALAAGAPDAPAATAGGCPAPASAPAEPAPAALPCVTAAPVAASSGGDGTKQPGHGFRRMCEASACHLRHQVPTGPGGKALRESAAAPALAPPGPVTSGAVVPAAAAGPPPRVTVLRC